MGLRSKIEIFWSEHRDPILFYAILGIGIIIIMRGIYMLTSRVDNQDEEILDNNVKLEDTIVTSQSSKDERKLVNQFIEYCKNEKLEEAYNLISDECKKEKYKTLADFKTDYYNKIFNKKRSIEVKKQKNNSYKVTFYEDMLETGEADESTSIVDYYTIQDSVIEIKININTQNNIK